MIENILPRQELLSLYRKKSKDCVFKSVSNSEVDAAILDGWVIFQKGKRKAKLSNPKPLDVLLEDRVWTLFYNLGLTALSSENGAKLKIQDRDGSPDNQVDFVGIDEEIALCVECKSALELKKDPKFQDKLGKLLAKK